MADQSTVAKPDIPRRPDGHGTAPGHSTAVPAPRVPGRRRWLPPAAVALTGGAVVPGLPAPVVTVVRNSDGASKALQAWDMLHGNLLLHGWSLPILSLYTTKLPQYMLIESCRGLSLPQRHPRQPGDDLHARRGARSVAGPGPCHRPGGLTRTLIAAGIMLAPQLGSGVFVLESSPGHIGTSVPLLATWLVLDRAGRRWWVPWRWWGPCWPGCLSPTAWRSTWASRHWP